MQHKVKVTVIDKKLYPELQARYCVDPQAAPVPATTWETSSFLNVMQLPMISGTWALAP